MLKKRLLNLRSPLCVIVLSSLFLMSVLSIPHIALSYDSRHDQTVFDEQACTDCLFDMTSSMSINEDSKINPSACDVYIASLILGTAFMFYGICGIYVWDFPFNMQYCVAGTLMLLLFDKMCL